MVLPSLAVALVSVSVGGLSPIGEDEFGLTMPGAEIVTVTVVVVPPPPLSPQPMATVTVRVSKNPKVKRLSGWVLIGVDLPPRRVVGPEPAGTKNLPTEPTKSYKLSQDDW